MTREELIEELEITREQHKNDIPFTTELNIAAMCTDVLDVLSRCEERKQGEWIEHRQKTADGYRDYIECPCCKVWFGKWEMPRNSFCPNCGADMKGESNND